MEINIGSDNVAKYDRELLVPYLQDVCSLHYAELEVACKMFEIQKKIIQLKHGREIEPPQEPEYEEEWNLISGTIAGAGVFLMVGPVVALLWGLLLDEFRNGQLGLVIAEIILGIPLGWFLWHMFGTPVKQAQRNNAERYEQYLADLRVYKNEKIRLEKEDEIARGRIPALESRLAYYSSERQKISNLLKLSYGAGVLPTQYRDVYAATYLYDYFSNSRADDLDQVLNTYVLEQIKDKLDEIIENQRISILQQRIILVNQQRSMEEQRAHNEYMRRKIRQIASSVEEQNQYLSMVECNTAATAYFAAAQYLR